MKFIGEMREDFLNIASMKELGLIVI